MSVSLEPEVTDDAAAPAAQAGGGRRGRGRLRWLWGIVALAVVGLVVYGVISMVTLATARTEPLDPANPSDNGSQALASVIADHDVRVDITRNQDQLIDAPRPDADTSVVVTETDALSARTARRFAEQTSDARRVILVSPSTGVLDALGLRVLEVRAPVDTSGGARTPPARCDAPWLGPLDTISDDGTWYFADTDDATSCFRYGDDAPMIVLPRTSTRPEVVVMSGAALRNDEITRFDNAGVAIRTLAPASRLLWYVPSRSDVVIDQPSAPSDIPRAIGPLIALALFLVLALMLWRGRRFGPLVTEPLPAVVKAIETTAARGRLYHRARAADRAAATLRAAIVENLSRHLGLPVPTRPAAAASTAIDALVVAAADATGRDRRDVGQLLAGPLPSTDVELVDFTTRLTALEKEVRRTP